MATLGIDFGTSNTSAAWHDGARSRIITLEGDGTSMPSAVFLDFAAREMLIGQAAAEAMINGRDGRFLRALKSVLGTALAREKRQLMNERLTLIDVLARFLGEIRARAEAATGQRFDAVLSGRPVRFHSRSQSRDAQARRDLEQAYRLAGFASVDFLPEPEAAALATGGEGRILIVDIGGGTSDFTVCQRRGESTRILASTGIRLGGTDFDKGLSLRHAMPLLGYGAMIGNEIGQGALAAPRALFHDLATWEKIAFVYGAATLNQVRRWERLAREPKLFTRLGEVLESHLGHEVAYAVEAAKIAANGAGAGTIALDLVEKGLSAKISGIALSEGVSDSARDIGDCALEAVARAGQRPEQIDRVMFVGGSSLLLVIQNRIGALFPGARMETADVFTAVVDGLAIAAR